MKNLTALFSLSILLASCGPSKSSTNDLAVSNPIVSSIDLTQTTNDKVPVTINPGRFTVDKVIYHLPRVVQGTYAVSDFGIFVENLKAIDYNGKEMAVVKSDNNSWIINNAKDLDKITYLVNDSFDVEGSSETVPFSPAGTNIEPVNYLLNLHGFIGYFDSLKNSQYSLEVTSPSNFKNSSALEHSSSVTSEDGSKTTITYFAPRYFDITDNPMMYGNLDVEEFMVGNIKIVLSVYSPNKVHTANSLKETIYAMMQGQKAYLGDLDSTPRYDIYLYLADNRADGPTGFGALEHQKSTVVVLREASSKESLAESMVDVVSHEFFHIVSPLSVHSEDVHYFDYDQPTFSKHLWMYEGVTEYFAQHFQVYEGQKTPEQFYATMMDKINTSKRMDDSMSFTKMSENIIVEPYASNYYNVYQKGALIGMCIDILMREESNGERSMLSLMKELSNKYGENKPFEDDNILNEIGDMTYPSVKNFLDIHVLGTTPIDYKVFLDKVGLLFEEGQVETNYIRSSNNFVFKADQDKRAILFTENVSENSFWADHGVKANDVLYAVNGNVITPENAQTFLGEMYQWKPGNEVEVTLMRNGEEIIIKDTLTKTYTVDQMIAENPNATPKQIRIRNSWLNLSSISK
ncbi:Predicted metalloprotease, contains C-terminal PDZ domain [Flavobacteriaceae bacterium MAR_2010_188]|nr:Predicted metalloprotease, contains C-terminal PDZ domain [Flavobacteriaceae bacterium MAR_2010_188]